MLVRLVHTAPFWDVNSSFTKKAKKTTKGYGVLFGNVYLGKQSKVSSKVFREGGGFPILFGVGAHRLESKGTFLFLSWYRWKGRKQTLYSLVSEAEPSLADIFRGTDQW